MLDRSLVGGSLAEHDLLVGHRRRTRALLTTPIQLRLLGGLRFESSASSGTSSPRACRCTHPVLPAGHMHASSSTKDSRRLGQRISESLLKFAELSPLSDDVLLDSLTEGQFLRQFRLKNTDTAFRLDDLALQCVVRHPLLSSTLLEHGNLHIPLTRGSLRLSNLVPNSHEPLFKFAGDARAPRLFESLRSTANSRTRLDLTQLPHEARRPVFLRRHSPLCSVCPLPLPRQS
mmetsp:Transcript_70840/g.153853  ORF Transcript_70840/g.153853 Transcript_70840/m.153853 type:complete len:232 (+) Transcript_70840:459-1154(+)